MYVTEKYFSPTIMGEPVSVFYHYTTVEGLRGIMAQGKIVPNPNPETQNPGILGDGLLHQDGPHKLQRGNCFQQLWVNNLKYLFSNPIQGQLEGEAEECGGLYRCQDRPCPLSLGGNRQVVIMKLF